MSDEEDLTRKRSRRAVNIWVPLFGLLAGISSLWPWLANLLGGLLVAGLVLSAVGWVLWWVWGMFAPVTSDPAPKYWPRPPGGE